MHYKLKMTAAIVGSFLLGAGAIQALHAQAKPPAFVVAEVNVKDRAGFEDNFLKSTKADISQHGGKYLAGGYDKTLSLVGAEPPNREHGCGQAVAQRGRRRHGEYGRRQIRYVSHLCGRGRGPVS